jgi:general secretion pathway protein D
MQRSGSGQDRMRICRTYADTLNMRKSSRACGSLSLALVSLCLVFATLLVLTQAQDEKAVRVSEEEVVGPPPTDVTVPPQEKKVVAPPPRPPVTTKPERPIKAKAKPIIPPQKRPVAAKTEAKAITPPERRPVKKEPEKRFVTIDFDNVDILLFIKFISEVTGKNFVIDDKVKGKVTIVSPTKISVDEAYKVFESVLEVHGFATVPSGSVVKIIPSVEARGKSIETRLREEATSPEDKVVTQLIRLDYANPDELKKLFAPLISKSSIMVSYPPSGMLVVTDVLSNIQRLLRIIKAIDVVGIGEEISVIPLEHATASNMVKTLTTIFQTTGRPTTTRTRKGVRGAAAAPSIRMVADERTNSLILSASEYDTSRIKQLIKILDQETPRGEGDIRVYYLQYADAEELATVLTALPKETKAPAKGKATAPVISKEVQIVADKATNSLVITANKQDYLALVDVIEKLDISRPMVFIEALIMEVTLSKNFDLGVEWRVGDDIGTWEGREVGAFGASGSGSTIGTAANPPGLSIGILGESITIGGVELPSLAAVVQAFQSNSDVHILQTPQIMTTDNEEAQVVVASNIPYLSKESAGTEQAYSVYEYKDVGVTLKITPQINQERFLRLEISLEYSTIKEGSLEDRPSTLKRSAETTVVMKDDHTVVIGGLVGEQINRGASGTPCLGNIPLLGRAFRSSSRSREMTNLYVFITPHIVEDPAEATRLYEEKKEGIDKMEESVIKMYEGR